VSNPATVMAYSNRYDTGSLFWEHVLTATGTATHLPNEASIQLRVAASGDKVVRQTRHYHPYQPGKSQSIKITSVMGAATANVRKRVGYFDEENGYYFEQDDDGAVYVVRRTATSGSAVNTEVAQASWNIDPLDGSGPSGLTLDLSKAQIFAIDMEWLGTGRVRMGFDISDGTVGKRHLIYVHEWLNANTLTTVHITTAALPVRYEIEATGAIGGDTDLIAVCAAIDSEGGLDESRGVPFSANNGATVVATSTTRTALVSIRPKATFNSITNRGQIIPESVSVYAAAGGVWELLYDSTLGGSPSWNSAHAHSVAEFSLSSGSSADGMVLRSGYIATATGAGSDAINTAFDIPLPLTLDAASTSPISLTLAFTALTGTPDAAGSINWRETR
jgi:hypothetical protein